MYDLIIVGMGPGGMSAAIYAKRSGLKTLILEKEAPGGLMNKTNLVDNYVGFDNISGPDLAFKMFEHVNNEKIEYKIEEVIDIKGKRGEKTVITPKKEYKTKTVIICSGRQKKRPPFEKEYDLAGKGISYCAVCDAALYKKLPVAVLGGGNSAFEEGIYLSNICSEVYIINRKKKLKADPILVASAKKKKNIKILKGVNIEKVDVLDDKIDAIILNNDKKIKVNGIFVYIGFEPATPFLNNLDIINEKGYIDVNDKMETSIKGIYACGDIIQKSLYQIVTAASEGAIAATSAKKYIEGLK